VRVGSNPDIDRSTNDAVSPDEAAGIAGREARSLNMPRKISITAIVRNGGTLAGRRVSKKIGVKP
jgi:hypothetical protein